MMPINRDFLHEYAKNLQAQQDPRSLWKFIAKSGDLQSLFRIFTVWRPVSPH
jgi:hypothetical protein